MSRVRAHNISMSLDGFVAGPDPSLDEPLGVNLKEWTSLELEISFRGSEKQIESRAEINNVRFER